ncbi:hypothetical protein [Streptomyces bicolor]|uniref:hypothetical protein n=1 Tax=Streptomyces bicolor TaxID=66874 RepID=UPI00131C4815|nr:hypothetical protein [Streptomyces bicolor]
MSTPHSLESQRVRDSMGPLGLSRGERRDTEDAGFWGTQLVTRRSGGGNLRTTAGGRPAVA